MTDEQEVLRVVVTGAAGQIAYSLLYQIASGGVFGAERPLALHLLDIPPMAEVLRGVVMELEDCALPLLRDIVPTVDPAVAFRDVSAAFLVGAMPRKQGMERKDLLQANVRIFKAQGEALDRYARKDCKVLVVGNPANTNALICSHYAPSLPKENFTAMTRLDQNRAVAQVAKKTGSLVSDVANVVIWGNHSSTQVPDASRATVRGGVSAAEAGCDEAWQRGEFLSTVQKRGAAVIAARSMSSALSAAKAAADHMRDWWQGTRPDDSYVSMGVMSDGSYGAPEGVVFSFPVRCTPDARWHIVPDLPLDDFTRAMLKATGDELLEERKEAMEVCEQAATA